MEYIPSPTTATLVEQYCVINALPPSKAVWTSMVGNNPVAYDSMINLAYRSNPFQELFIKYTSVGALVWCLETVYSFLGIKFRTPKFNAQRGITLKAR